MNLELGHTPYVTHPDALASLAALVQKLRKLWLPPPKTTIEEWAQAKRRLPAQSGRPGKWTADPIQREIQAACCDPDVREVVFMKSTRLGWSEICNNVLGWGIDIHHQAMLMLQPSRDMAEKYSKERLEDMIESTPALQDALRVATSKGTGSNTRFKRFRGGGSFFVASAGNPRELRATKARTVIEDEADGYQADVSDEGDPDKLVRRRGDEFHDFTLLIGSTPALPKGVSRIDRAYNRSSMALHLNPCPHCNAEEPFLWRHPDNPELHLLTYEKDAQGQVIPESVRFTCIRCSAKIEEKWKVSMMEAGHWHHRRDIRTVRGFWANGLYAMFPGHWAKMAQEWVEAQGQPLELKAFINLHLAETYETPGESVDPSWLRKRADAEDRPRGIVADGVAILLVQVDVQTAGIGRLEAHVVGMTPDEQAFLVDIKTFPGNPLEGQVWEDLDEWLLAGWTHANGGRMKPHLTFIDARDGNVRDAVYAFCGARADRWVFPQMGVERISSRGWCEESTTKKSTVRLFLTGTDDVKRTLMSRLNQGTGAVRSIHLAAWVTDDYLNQVASEKRMPVTDLKTKKTTWKWVKTQNRNEALDLWVYALSGWWAITRILAPDLAGPNGKEILENLARQASEAREDVIYAQASGRRIRSQGYR
jgi:phage terminase large subunit GpA-like protein